MMSSSIKQHSHQITIT